MKYTKLQWQVKKDEKAIFIYFFNSNSKSHIKSNYATYNPKTKLLFVEFGAGVNYYPSEKQTKMKRELHNLLQPLRTMFEFSIGSMSKGKQNYSINYYAIVEDMPTAKQMLQLEDILLRPRESDDYRGMTLREIKKEIAQQQRYEFKRKIAEDDRWQEHLMEYCG